MSSRALPPFNPPLKHRGDPRPALNCHQPDIESDLTGRGRHNRLIVMRDLRERVVTVREDLQGLPPSTPADRMRAANGWQRQHPAGTKLTPIESVESNGSIFHTYSY